MDGDMPALEPFEEPTGCPGIRSAGRELPYWLLIESEYGCVQGRLGWGTGSGLRVAWDGHLDED
jgi:hypothetical protein